MGVWILVIVIVVVVLAAAAVPLARRRRVAPPTVPEPEPAPPRPSPPPSTPMNDLESALAKVTDREGRPIKDRIDAETTHVDPLRDPDDTGPLLRRALDSVEHHDETPTDDTGPRTSDA